MLKAALLKRYQKFWIKRSLRAKHKVETYAEFSTLRLLCEGLLNDEDRELMEQIMMDDIMDRTVDTVEDATYNRLVAALQSKDTPFIVNCYLHDGSTPLHIVAKAGFSDSVRLLIQHNANVNAIHAQLGHSVLHVATMAGSYKSMNHLVNAGASRTFVNTMAGRRRSALHYAAERGCAVCLLMLLNPTQGNVVQRNEEQREIRGILDLQDSFGNTALHLACVDGSEECVKILIEAGANATVRNIEGKTPVDIARAMNGSCTVGAVLFLVLIAAGLDPMNETLENPTASGESAAETVVGTEDSFHTGRTAVSLLDDIVSEGNSSTGALPVPGAAERGDMWVIVQEGMLVCSFPPPVESFLFNHKKPDPSKISKRLRFVRRSIIGSYGSDADTGETSLQQGGTGGGGGGGGGRSTSQQENQGSGVKISKVEVFTSRAEAEERARSFIQADVRAHKSKVTVNGFASSISIPSAGAGMQQQQQQQQQGLGLPSNAAGGGATSAAAWGSHRRSIGNNSLSSSNLSGDSSFRGGGSSSGGGGISVITAAEYKPTTVYHVACIHSERLALFKATVPHYFPLKEAARIPNSPLPHSKNHTPHSFNNYNKNINEDLEDPMWASFKRSHSSNALKTSNYYGGGGIYSDTSDTSSAFQDTSRSNKPVKLLPAPPSQRIAALTDLSSNPSGSHGEGSTAERGAQQEMTATLGGSGNSSAVAADVNSALPTTQSSSKPPPRSISKKQLAEEEMELTTSIAAANAQIFELMCLLEELQASRKLQESSGSGSGSGRSHDVESPSAAAAAAESASSVATENPLPEPEPVVADLLELSITEDPPATAQTTALSTELSADANHASSKEADFSLASLDGASSQGMQSYSSAQDQAAHAETEGYGEVGSEGVFDLYADMEMHIQHAHEDIAVGTSSPTASAAGTLVELFASSPISMKEPASPVTVDVAITATTPVAITAATPGPTSAAKNGADEPEESDNARLIIGEDIEIEEGNDGHESSSSKSGAGVDTPMPDFKSPALRSPIHIHLDQAERDRNRNGHKNGNGDGNGGVALNMGLELEMERLVLSVNEDLHLYGHEGAGGTGGREEEGLEKLGDLSEESLAYLSQQEASASASASASAAGAVAKEEAEEERDSGSLRWEEP